MGQNELVAHDTVASAHFSGIHRFEDPVGTTAIVPNCGGFSHPVWYVLYGVVVLFYAIPL